jgi:hypothetical protein
VVFRRFYHLSAEESDRDRDREARQLSHLRFCKSIYRVAAELKASCLPRNSLLERVSCLRQLLSGPLSCGDKLFQNQWQQTFLIFMKQSPFWVLMSISGAIA